MPKYHMLIARVKSLLLNKSTEGDIGFVTKPCNDVVNNLRKILFKTSTDWDKAADDFLKFVDYKFFNGINCPTLKDCDIENLQFDIVKVTNGWFSYDKLDDFYNLTKDRYVDMKNNIAENKFFVETMRAMVTLFVLTMQKLYGSY
jgi:hypothetical protein